MPHSATLPFVLVRQNRVIGMEVTTITEEVHGLLHLDGDRIRLQWRVARSTARVGWEIRTDTEMEPVAAAEVAVSSLAGAEVRRRWWSRLGLPGGLELVVRAADLQAFEPIAGMSGLRLEHPAELVIPVRRRDRLAAHGFAAELELAIAEQEMADVAERPAIPGAEPGASLPDTRAVRGRLRE